jgi:hypothetical protein
MALVNCTINSSQVTVAKGSQIGGSIANQVLTIIPNTGFVLRASDFTAGSPPAGISSIVLANSGTAYATNNTVTVTCDLTDTGSYNASTSLTIDIDGSAVLEKDIPKTLAGAVTTTATNASGAASNVAYTATDTTGVTKDLFTKTVTANSNFFFSTEPTISITTGDIHNYSITSTTSNDGGGNLNSKTFNVDGIIPLENDLNDVIAISAVASAIPVVTNNIKSYSFDTSTARYTLAKRTFKAYGDVGAKYKLTVTRTGDSHTYNFTTKDFTSSATDSGEQTISSSGFNEQEFTFPTVTADVTYTFTLTAVSPTTLALTQTHPFTVARVGNKSITVNATSTERGTFQSKVITYTNYAGTAINQTTSSNATYGFAGTENNDNNEAEFNFSIVIDDDQAFVFKAPNASANTITLSNSNWSVAPSGATAATIADGTLTVTRSADSGSNANQLLTITGTDWYGWKIGTANTVINVNVDTFAQDPNTAPVANTVSISVNKGAGTLTTLNATDADSDSLTYTIVSVPGQGSLFTDAGKGTAVSAGTTLAAATVYYEHNNSSNFSDSFTYKANDGTIDSNTATVNATVGVSAGSSLSTSGDAGIYIVPIVVGTSAGTLRVHCDAFTVPDRFELLFATGDPGVGNPNVHTDSSILQVSNSRFVGDGVTSSNPANGTTSGLNKYEYVGSGGNATGSGEPGAAWNKTATNQSVTIADTDVVTDSGQRTDLDPHGDGRNSASSQQFGLQNKVTTNGSGGTALGLDYHDGNVAMRYTKATTTNAYVAFVRVTGVDSSTAWSIHATSFDSLTSYQSSTIQTSPNACTASLGETYYHNGTNALPVVGDHVYANVNASATLASGFYRLNNSTKMNVSANGLVYQITSC